MKQTRTVKWNLESGKEITAEITIERVIITEKEIWMDQYITTDCYELHASNEIVCSVDGKRVACEFAIRELDEMHETVRKTLPAGTFGKIGRVCLKENSYHLVKDAYTAALVSAESDPAVVAYRKREAAQEALKVAAQKETDAYDNHMRACGLCDKCGTFCCGDCEAR